MSIEQNYFKVDVEYLQQTQLLVAAKSAEAAEALVRENVLETTQGFRVLGVAELSDEEKEYVVKQMMGVEDAETETEEPRTIN